MNRDTFREIANEAYNMTPQMCSYHCRIYSSEHYQYFYDHVKNESREHHDIPENFYKFLLKIMFLEDAASLAVDINPGAGESVTLRLEDGLFTEYSTSFDDRIRDEIEEDDE